MKTFISVFLLCVGFSAFAQKPATARNKLKPAVDKVLILRNAINLNRQEINLTGSATVMTGDSINAKSKKIKFAKGAMLGGSGVFTNAYVKASQSAQIFDTSLSVYALTNPIVYAAWFGFLPTATAAQNTRALQRISDFINNKSGGLTLIFGKGIFIAGGQDFAGKYGKGFAYKAKPLITLVNCTKPVFIKGDGTVIKMADGQRMGAFNPVSGRAINTGITADVNNRADPGIFFRLHKNKSVFIRDLTLDGNCQNFIIGGPFGDTGYQCEADGVFATYNDSLVIENLTANYQGRDGVMVGNSPSMLQKVFLTGSSFSGNGRQGMSWIGGLHFYAKSSSFCKTGRTINKGSGLVLTSMPGSGLDIEAEYGLCANGLFDSCLFEDNAGVGVLNPSTPARNNRFVNCKIVGTTTWALWFDQPSAVFENTTIIGSITGFYHAKGYDDSARTVFRRCTISTDAMTSKSRKTYRWTYMLDYTGKVYTLFTHCVINAVGSAMAYTADAQWDNCIFRQDNMKPSYARGLFTGDNRFYNPHGVQNDFYNSKVSGKLYLNDTLCTRL